MGKRKKDKNQPQPAKKSPLGQIGLAVMVLAVVAGTWFFTKSPTIERPPVDPSGPLLETRPVLSASFFTGKAAKAYQYAAEIPKVIDSQFCYCYCKKNHGHKTLLTCFTNTHGSKCDVCMDEVIYAYQLHKEGKTIDEIVVAIDKKFYRPYRRS